MQIKLRKNNEDGHLKVESAGTIKEVIITEDLLHPKAESVSVCFRGKNSSGILILKTHEIEHIYKSIKGKTHLVKSAGKLSE